MFAKVLAATVTIAALPLAACEDSASALADAAAPASGAAHADGGSLDDAGAAFSSGPEAGPSDNPSGQATSPPWRDGGLAAAPDAERSDGGLSDLGGSAAPTDYAKKGPFSDAKMFGNAGADGTYFLFRPDTSLGRDGFKHPIGVWGNGLTTTPDEYQQLLGHVASYGFVVVACPDITAEEPCLSAGLEWLVEQNSGSGPLAGKLDVSKEFALGFSWGGGAAIDVSKRPNIKATISVHGMPPRSDPWSSMHAPLALFSSTGDTIVPVDQFVTTNYNDSRVQTFFATIQDEMLGHLFTLDPDSLSCATGAPDLLGIGPCTGGREEQAPIVAWLRYWISGDQGARGYFFGDACQLCGGQWKTQRKNWN